MFWVSERFYGKHYQQQIDHCKDKNETRSVISYSFDNSRFRERFPSNFSLIDQTKLYRFTCHFWDFNVLLIAIKQKVDGIRNLIWT